MEPAEISGTFSSPLIIVFLFVFFWRKKRTVQQHQIGFPGKFFQNFFHSQFKSLPYADFIYCFMTYKNKMAFKIDFLIILFHSSLL